jgi:hypothetical protein
LRNPHGDVGHVRAVHHAFTRPLHALPAHLHVRHSRCGSFSPTPREQFGFKKCLFSVKACTVTQTLSLFSFTSAIVFIAANAYSTSAKSRFGTEFIKQLPAGMFITFAPRNENVDPFFGIQISKNHHFALAVSQFSSRHPTLAVFCLLSFQ